MIRERASVVTPSRWTALRWLAVVGVAWLAGCAPYRHLLPFPQGVERATLIVDRSDLSWFTETTGNAVQLGKERFLLVVNVDRRSGALGPIGGTFPSERNRSIAGEISRGASSSAVDFDRVVHEAISTQLDCQRRARFCIESASPRVLNVQPRLILTSADGQTAFLHVVVRLQLLEGAAELWSTRVSGSADGPRPIRGPASWLDSSELLGIGVEQAARRVARAIAFLTEGGQRTPGPIRSIEAPIASYWPISPWPAEVVYQDSDYALIRLLLSDRSVGSGFHGFPRNAVHVGPVVP